MTITLELPLYFQNFPGISHLAKSQQMWLHNSKFRFLQFPRIFKADSHMPAHRIYGNYYNWFAVLANPVPEFLESNKSNLNSIEST